MLLAREAPASPASTAWAGDATVPSTVASAAAPTANRLNELLNESSPWNALTRKNGSPLIDAKLSGTQVRYSRNDFDANVPPPPFQWSLI
ncbi:hypothetical protein GCM10018773_21710 [Streptomyces candidus]|nr:hypothetical protein GCM10018773_21710 [Streptomyces candidus]